MNLECLATLVGLDDSDCECFEDGRPETYNTSESGYYVTELMPVKDNILANKDCADGTIWDFLIRARSKAIRDFQNDVTVSLSEVKNTPGAWRGTIGKIESKSYLTTPSLTHGVQFRTRNGKRYKDQRFIIKAIWVNVNTNDGITLNWNSNIPDFTDQDIALTTTAGRFNRNALETPISLDLYNVFQDCVHHDFTFEPGEIQPATNRVYCCSRPGWMNQLEVCGISTNSYELDKEYNSRSMYGLAFEGYFSCNKLQFFCELDELNASALKHEVAKSIQYASAVNALNEMLRSNKVNQFTLLDLESAYKMRSKYQKAYNDTIYSIARNVPSGFSSCWGCDKNAHKVGYLMT